MLLHCPDTLSHEDGGRGVRTPGAAGSRRTFPGSGRPGGILGASLSRSGTHPPPPRFFSTGPAEGGDSPPLRRCPSLAGRNAGPLFRGPGPAHPRRGTPPSADGGRPAGTVAGRGPAARFLVRCGAAAAAGLSPPRARRRDEVR